MNDLEGKVVLVTGASRGIGRAIALAFGSQKSRVAIVGRNQTTLDVVAAKVRALGAESFPRVCDVTQKPEVERLKQDIEDRFGAVQVLVNNVGMAPAAEFLAMDDGLWEEVLKVNLTSVYNCCKVFLAGMIAAKWGRIINIASTVAKVSYPYISAYATSKHAVLGLTRSLAIETAKFGVTVNSVCPGYVNTDLTQKNSQLLAEKINKPVEEALAILANTSPQKRLMEPEEVASLTVLLASGTARGITGQAINIDGGAVMG